MRMLVQFSIAMLAPAVYAADLWIGALGGSLIQDAGGNVVEISLRGTWVTDADVVRLAAHPKLRRLDLSRTHLNDRALEPLQKLAALTDLDLTYAEHITDAGLARLRNVRSLERLSLEGTKVTDSGVNSIAALSNLRALNLRCTQITDSALEKLESLVKLETLEIGGNRVAGFGLAYLEALPNLKQLDLSGVQLTDDGIWSVGLTDLNIHLVAGLTRLESLNLASSELMRLKSIPDGGIREFASIRVTDLGVEQLTALKRLRSLDLSRSQVTARGLGRVAGLAELEYLALAYAENVDDDAVAALARMKHLRTLDLSYTKVSPARAAALRRQLPKCRIVGR